MTTRPDPTPADLLAAARALLAQAEAMMREPAQAAPTLSKPDPDDATVWRGWVAPTTFTTWPDGVAVGVDHGKGPDAMASLLARYHAEPPTWTATPAAPPVQEPEPKPSGVVLTGWRMFGRDGWELWDTAGLVQAAVGTHGWACRDISTTGPETGLHGKELAVERLLADGARWESIAAELAHRNHDTRAINRFRPGDVAVMTDGSQRTVEETTRTRILFADGTWLSFDAAEAAMAARIPADAKT